MCCLKYEQDAYEDLLKDTPKLESLVNTPDGVGVVNQIQLLREQVKVVLDSDPDTPKVYRKEDIEIIRNGKGKRPPGYEFPVPAPEKKEPSLGLLRAGSRRHLLSNRRWRNVPRKRSRKAPIPPPTAVAETAAAPTGTRNVRQQPTRNRVPQERLSPAKRSPTATPAAGTAATQAAPVSRPSRRVRSRIPPAAAPDRVGTNPAPIAVVTIVPRDKAAARLVRPRRRNNRKTQRKNVSLHVY